MPRGQIRGGRLLTVAALALVILPGGQSRELGAWKEFSGGTNAKGLRAPGENGTSIEIGCDRPGSGSVKLKAEFGKPIGDDATSDAYHVHAAKYQLDGGQWRALPTIFYQGTSAAITVDPERSEIIKLIADAAPARMAVSVRTFQGDEAVANADVTGVHEAVRYLSAVCEDPTIE